MADNKQNNPAKEVKSPEPPATIIQHDTADKPENKK